MDIIGYLWQQASPVELHRQAQCIHKVRIATGRPHTTKVLRVPHLVSYEGRGMQQLLPPVDVTTSAANRADAQSDTQQSNMQQHKAAHGNKSGC
jgi:hypothetical protein